MTYKVEGDYFEACSCSVSCPCIFLNPGTADNCDVFFAWHIARGEKDSVKLDGLNVALAVHSPKLMTDGGWRVALYLDEKASQPQTGALTAIFAGQAGGHLAAVAPLIGEVTGVHKAAIVFAKDGLKRSIKVGDALDMAVGEITGMDGQRPIVISNAPLGAVAQPLRQAKAERIHYQGPWRFDSTGTNAFLAEFRYEA